MHATEGRPTTRFARLDGVALEVDGYGRVETCWGYVGRRGALADQGRSVPLAAVRAENRRGTPLLQDAVLDLAATAWRPMPRSPLHPSDDRLLDHPRPPVGAVQVDAVAVETAEPASSGGPTPRPANASCRQAESQNSHSNPGRAQEGPVHGLQRRRACGLAARSAIAEAAATASAKVGST